MEQETEGVQVGTGKAAAKARRAGYRVAEGLLRGRDISPDGAARLVLEALEESDDYLLEEEKDLSRVRQIIRLGVECYRQESNTVTFSELVELLLHKKSHRRERTLQEILQYARRMMKNRPEWRSMPVRLMSPHECRGNIEQTFQSPVMRRKARVLLHGLFAFARKQGWCSENPLDQVEFPPCRERRIYALDIARVRNLLKACFLPEHTPCAAALGLLLWAGIRPRELERLRWKYVSLQDKLITIPPEHAKTGGARLVVMKTILKNWLAMNCPTRLPEAHIVPPSWGKRWRALRQAAGIMTWDADVLRHTYASYHLRRFRNLTELQLDMGHGSTELLRTRYLNMEGVTADAAAEFWGMNLHALRAEMRAERAGGGGKG